MNVLIACEESQTVCIEFRKKGHRAFSCDTQECSGGHPEWHIQGDVLKLLNGNCEFILQNGQTDRQTDSWDLIIAHPPCTHLAVSGARHFEKKREDGRQREGVEFFCKFLECKCEKIVIENPIGIISGNYIKKYFPDIAEKYNFPKRPTQIISPWNFGDDFEKRTCLWIKGLNPLIPLIVEKPKMEYKEWIDKKTGKIKRQNKWCYDALCKNADERSKIRSKTFPGIAKAMAEQWE